jgi:choline dehydrogenase-like flavoprotein
LSDAITILGNASLDRFDALVIGSGASGGAVAAMLASHGQKVLVLEAGPNYFPGIDQPLSPAAPVQPCVLRRRAQFLQRFRSSPIDRRPRTFPALDRRRRRLAVGDYAFRQDGGRRAPTSRPPQFLHDDLRLGCAATRPKPRRELRAARAATSSERLSLPGT